METIKIHVTGSTAQVTACPPLVAGTVGMPVEYTFGEAWKDLQKTAVFRCDGVTYTVLHLEDTARIPWEVLQKSGWEVLSGVYGASVDGMVQTPTLWVSLGRIQPGADPTGDESADPTLPVWQQVYNKVDACVQQSLTAAKDDFVRSGLEALPVYGGEAE
jgi:hypothetical protein